MEFGSADCDPSGLGVCPGSLVCPNRELSLPIPVGIILPGGVADDSDFCQYPA